MKKEDLRKAMSDISDEFILEAAPDTGSPEVIPVYSRPWFRLASSLAAACVVIVLGLGVYRNRPLPKQSAPSQSGTVPEKAEPPVTAAQEDGAAEMEMDADLAEPMEIPPGQALQEEKGADQTLGLQQHSAGESAFLMEERQEAETESLSEEPSSEAES